MKTLAVIGILLWASADRLLAWGIRTICLPPGNKCVPGQLRPSRRQRMIHQLAGRTVQVTKSLLVSAGHCGFFAGEPGTFLLNYLYTFSPRCSQMPHNLE